MSFHEKREFLTISKQYLVQLINRKLLAFIQAARVIHIFEYKLDNHLFLILLYFRKELYQIRNIARNV